MLQPADAAGSVLRAPDGQARVLQGIALQATDQAPLTGNVTYSMPHQGQIALDPVPVACDQAARGELIRKRVVLVSVTTAVYYLLCIIVSAAFGYVGLELVSAKLRSLPNLQEMEGMSWLVRVLPSVVMMTAVPSMLLAALVGSLFALCGLCGARGNNSCCACCYCCCNAFSCITGTMSLLSLFAFIRYMTVTGQSLELWLDKCDPSICMSSGAQIFDQAHAVDCLAPGIWRNYHHHFRKPWIPKDCPPIFLKCNSSYAEPDEPLPKADLDIDEDFHFDEPVEKPFNIHAFAPEMPEDPLSMCTPSQDVVKVFDVAKQESPNIFSALATMAWFRILIALPLLVLWSLGFWWGQELWSKLRTPSYAQFQGQPNVHFLQHGEMQLSQMSEPLILNAPVLTTPAVATAPPAPA